MANWVDARTFGAIGDGTVDDSTAIQAVINGSQVYLRKSGAWVPANVNEITVVYQFQPGTPQMKLATLPSCRDCPDQVKPGEDLCWGCLHEDQGPDEEFIFHFVATSDITVSKATFSTSSGYTWQNFTPIPMNNGDSLQLTWKPSFSTSITDFPTGLLSVT